jgi:hypothetical protein
VESGCTTETSAMAMPRGRTMRMSPRASSRVAEPSAAVPEPASRPGRRRRGGSRAEAIPARCTARRNVPLRMSWRSVSCAARARHRMAWSASACRSVAPQPHCTYYNIRIICFITCRQPYLFMGTQRPSCRIVCSDGCYFEKSHWNRVLASLCGNLLRHMVSPLGSRVRYTQQSRP